MKKTKHLSLLEYAKKRGVSDKRIYQLVQAGKLTAKKIKGKLTVNPVTADREWSDNVIEKFRNKTSEGLEKDESYIDTDINSDGIDKDNASEVRRIAEARKELWKAKREQLDYEEKLGLLVPVDQIKKEAFETAQVVRNAILVIPDKISAELVGIKDQATMHAALMKELNTALIEISNVVDKISISAGVQPGLEAGPITDGQRVG